MSELWSITTRCAAAFPMRAILRFTQQVRQVFGNHLRDGAV